METEVEIMKTVSMACALFFLGMSAAYAGNLFVSPGGTGAGCGASDPCGTIQAAVDVAVPNDKIHVAPGTYVENVNIPSGKDGLSITGAGSNNTIVESAGGLPGKFAPPMIPIDVIVDIFSSGVTISKMTLVHPAGPLTKRDLGVFVRPPAMNVTVEKSTIRRDRTGEITSPPQPGSRGVFVLRATGTVISKNDLRGFYEDHIHLPTSEAMVVKNSVEGATRIGIAIIQEPGGPPWLSINNEITKNEVSGSGTDGIQIQGDNNTVLKNDVHDNAGVGIKLCGPSSSPACVAPGGSASADDNTVTKNKLANNAGGSVVDDGVNNTVN
jgi:parallel beta-helix repeat protein